MTQFGVDAVRFPLVVDSDQDKVGTFAPGTGQEIRFRDWLIDHPTDSSWSRRSGAPGTSWTRCSGAGSTARPC